MLTFGSMCSGIEAASVAWEPLGWKAAWLAEIEPFPSAVLAHHYPNTPNWGDMNDLPWMIDLGGVAAPDVVCGGTPCQAFSVAGLRNSLDDARGNLSLKFCEIADAVDTVRAREGKEPAIIFWENVPGVLSTKDNAFGCFLAGLAGEECPLEPPGAKWTNAGYVLGPKRAVAWRVLDAQYFGVAQRRRRVFVVASARNGFDPAAVLFEWDGRRRDSAPSRKAGEAVAPTIRAGAANGGPGHGARSGDSKDELIVPAMQQAFGGNKTSGPRDVSSALSAHGGTGRLDFESETFVTHSLRAEGFDASEDGTGRGTPLVPVFAFDTTQVTSKTNGSNPKPGDPCHPLSAGAHAPAIAFHPTQNPISSTDVCHSIGANANATAAVATAFPLDLRNALRDPEKHDAQNRQGVGVGADGEPMATLTKAHVHGVATGTQVRRLTPVECARLQGFPDNYLDITVRGKPAADGPKYKALGNSWAVPKVRWLGRRIRGAL